MRYILAVLKKRGNTTWVHSMTVGCLTAMIWQRRIAMAFTRRNSHCRSRSRRSVPRSLWQSIHSRAYRWWSTQVSDGASSVRQKYQWWSGSFHDQRSSSQLVGSPKIHLPHSPNQCFHTNEHWERKGSESKELCKEQRVRWGESKELCKYRVTYPIIFVLKEFHPLSHFYTLLTNPSIFDDNPTICEILQFCSRQVCFW